MTRAGVWRTSIRVPCPPLGSFVVLQPSCPPPCQLPCMFDRHPDGCLLWAATLAGELLSLSAWLQISLLSGYSKKATTRAAHSAIPRALSTSPNDYTRTVQYLYTIRDHLPMPHCCHLTFVHTWLTQRAHWMGRLYSSWILAPELSLDGTRGFWCWDWSTLSAQVDVVRPKGYRCP